MGYSYYACVYFPKSAAKIAAINESLKNTRDTVSEIGECICVESTNAQGGIIEITDVLGEHKIPYDHYHRDDNAMEEWTEKYRIQNNEWIMSTTSAETKAVSDLASEVLKALEEGNLDFAKSRLKQAVIPEVLELTAIAAQMKEGV